MDAAAFQLSKVQSATSDQSNEGIGNLPIYTETVGRDGVIHEVGLGTSHRSNKADPVNVIVKAAKTNGTDETNSHYTFSSFAPAMINKAQRNDVKHMETVKSNNTIVI